MKIRINILILFFISLTINSCNTQSNKKEPKQVFEAKKRINYNESNNLQIDHIVCLVRNIDLAANLYTKKGFTVKKGSLHKNGLINGHIKFNNKTSIELMSIKGTPTDEISKNYLKLLKNGEGGVFISISGIETSVMEKRLNNLEIDYNTITGENWDYITFPETSSLAHFFFIDSKFEIKDSIDILTHKNNSEKIKEVWIEGDTYVKYFLNGLGLKSMGKTVDMEIGEGERFLTNSGEIIVIPNKAPNSRPRIKLISIENKINAELLKIRF